MKDLKIIYTIIRKKVNYNLKVKILLINQYNYVYNLLKSKNMTNCNLYNCLIKVRLFFNIDYN